MPAAKTSPSARQPSLSDFEITVEYPVPARAGTDEITGVRAAAASGNELTWPQGSQADYQLLAQGEVTEVSSTPSAVQAYFVPASESLVADAEACLAAFRLPPTAPITWAQRMVLAAKNTPAPPSSPGWLDRALDLGDRFGELVCRQIKRARRWLRCSTFARALRLKRCRFCEGNRAWTSFDVVLPPGMAKQAAAAARAREWDLFKELARLRAASPTDSLSATIASCQCCGKHTTLELTWKRGRLRRLIASDIDIDDDDRYLLLSLIRR